MHFVLCQKIRKLCKESFFKHQIMKLQLIQQKIYEIRGIKVMLDFDLASLYEVETKALKQSVRRNINRFPPDFMFELTVEEHNLLITNNRSQIVTGSEKKIKHSSALPFAFSEQGVAMLSAVLRSEKAIEVNINIMRAFVVLRQYAISCSGLNRKLEQFMRETNMQFNDIYQALSELATHKARENTPRTPIGFRQ